MCDYKQNRAADFEMTGSPSKGMTRQINYGVNL
jgi:hypothetical protein